MKLILIGSTGLVGREVLRLALASPQVDSVLALTRRPLPAHPKLQTRHADFEHLPPDAPWWQAGAVICTLGTTIRKAGSQDAFRKVDHDYPLQVGRLARAAGTPAYVLNSALGADAASRIFYNRVKGDVERSLAALGFPSLTLVRPGLIGGAREEFRLGERFWIAVLSALGPLVPKSLRINPAQAIARALLQAALHPAPGVSVIPSDQLTGN